MRARTERALTDRRLRSLSLLAAVLAAFAHTASVSAQVDAAGTLHRATEALRSSPVYIDPHAERAISPGDTARLRTAIGRYNAGPLFIAVLPSSAADETGGDPGAALRELALSVAQTGTYAAVIGNSFRAGATAGVLPQGTAGALAAQALRAKRGAGTESVLEDFIRRVGQARAGGAGGADRRGGSGGSGFPTALLLVLLAIPAALFGLRRWRRAKRQRADFERVRRVARDDLIALGDDIRRLDLDVEMPNARADAKQHYALAVDRYSQAEEALERARRPEDLEGVTNKLEEGRWAMAAAAAELEGRPPPERRLPCFFDPRHGPSVTDVEWAPPGGQPRPVPACAADALRIQEGGEPSVRQVAMGGGMVPYWQAGSAFAPWAGGFFGGGLLPGFFLGTMIGDAFAGFGDFDHAYAASAADPGDFADGADSGGGDFGGGGDFSSGGDFGGGDFGGGDVGGGGNF
jgi:hypothetical protein